MKKLKKWHVVVLVFVVLMVIGIIIDGGDTDNEETNKVADKGSNKAEVANEERDEKKVDSNKEEKVYNIGDVQKIGNIEYKVDSKEVKHTIGNEYLYIEAQNNFFILIVTIKNDGNEPITVSDSFFKLKDGDKTSDTKSSYSVYLEDASIISKNINPDASLTGKIIFDISDTTISSKNLQLQVQTGIWGTEKGYFKLN